MVHQAAAKAGVTQAEYMRRIVLKWAASDLGLPEPSEAEMRGGASLVAEAAKMTGVSVAEFRERAAAEVAAKMLSDRPPAPQRRSEPPKGR